MNFDSSAFVCEPALLQKLLKHAASVDCGKSRVLFRQGEAPSGLFILRGGEATMFLESESGALLVRTQLAPGSLLGLPALMSSQPYSMSAIAKRGAVVNYVTNSDLSASMLAEPLLALEVLRIFAMEVHTTRAAIAQSPGSSEEQPEDLASEPSHSRVN